MGDEGSSGVDEKRVDDRIFRRDQESRSWRPVSPRPFEVVEGDDGLRWYWEPSEQAWVSVAVAPEVGEPPGYVVRGEWIGDG